jgi:hypothetical protein
MVGRIATIRSRAASKASLTKAGKVTTSGRLAVSADGKTRTTTTTTTDPQGKKVASTAVYDKQ